MAVELVWGFRIVAIDICGLVMEEVELVGDRMKGTDLLDLYMACLELISLRIAEIGTFRI